MWERSGERREVSWRAISARRTRELFEERAPSTRLRLTFDISTVVLAREPTTDLCGERTLVVLSALDEREATRRPPCARRARASPSALA